MESKLKFWDVVRYLWRWQDWEMDHVGGEDFIKNKYSNLCFTYRGGVCLRDIRNLEVVYRSMSPAVDVFMYLTKRIEKKLKNRNTINA